MEAFTTVRSVVAPLIEDNINTDDIAPTDRIKSLSADLAKSLFGSRRYLADGQEDAGFILNQDPFRNSKIMLTGANFGCGSSRELAVWALMRFGFRCIIGRSFSDIFAENSLKNGLLLIELTDDMPRLLQWVKEHTGEPMTVSLQDCLITAKDGLQIQFPISSTRRQALLEGLDDISRTLKYEADIAAFQQKVLQLHPWTISPAE